MAAPLIPIRPAPQVFYIALKPLVDFDGRYAVFGPLWSRPGGVDKIRQGRQAWSATVRTGGEHGGGMPLRERSSQAGTRLLDALILKEGRVHA